MDNLTNKKDIRNDAKREVTMDQAQESVSVYKVEFKIPDFLKKYSRLTVE